MKITDLVLLAILKTVPKEKEKLLLEDFDKEMSKMEIDKDDNLYKFLFEKGLIMIYDSVFRSLQASSSEQYQIKTSAPLHYVHRSTFGDIVLYSLQAEHLREEFSQFESRLLESVEK